MGCEDYDWGELKGSIETLLDEQREKLNKAEVLYLQNVLQRGWASCNERAYILSMFDRMGEPGY